jgi:hypothetical protein
LSSATGAQALKAPYVLEAPFDRDVHTLRITPRDMDGFLIDRRAAGGESQSLAIEVTVSFDDAANKTRVLSARHDLTGQSADYVVDVRTGQDEWFVPGSYSIKLSTPLGESSKAIVFEVRCASDYSIEGSACVVNDSTNWKIGVGLACAFAAVLGVLLYLVRKNKERAREIIKSFLQFEALLAAEVLVELWDLLGRCRHLRPPNRARTHRLNTLMHPLPLPFPCPGPEHNAPHITRALAQVRR